MAFTDLSSHRDSFFKLRAWFVHFYTSLGLIAGLLAMRAIIEGNVKQVFLFLALALWLDASDGPMARRWDTKQWASKIDGRRLDDIIDYLNYTFIPVFFAYYFELVIGWGLGILGLVLLSSAYGFCGLEAKTEEHYFTGFPSYWNLLIFYLYLLGAPPWVNALILVIFAALVWIPVKYVTYHTKHPLFNLTWGLMVLWFLSLIAIMFTFEKVPPLLLWGSLSFPFYYLLLSFYLHFTGKNRVAASLK